MMHAATNIAAIPTTASQPWAEPVSIHRSVESSAWAGKCPKLVEFEIKAAIGSEVNRIGMRPAAFVISYPGNNADSLTTCSRRSQVV